MADIEYTRCGSVTAEVERYEGDWNPTYAKWSIWACDQCGALVADKDAHSEHHASRVVSR